MTNQLQQINDICLQCNGYHCCMAKTKEYKNCTRYRLLEPFHKAGQDILKLDDMNIKSLAEHLLACNKMKITDASVEQLNLALRTIDKWR